jgi:hypothetical protein
MINIFNLFSSKKTTVEDLTVSLKKHIFKLSDSIVKDSNLGSRERKQSLCEIRIFYWVISTSFLQEKLSIEAFQYVMMYFRNEIVFSSVDEDEYSEIFIINLLETRETFYSECAELLSNINSVTAERQISQLRELWLKKPFCEISELQNKMVIDFLDMKSPIINKYWYLNQVVQPYHNLLLELTKKVSF